MLKNTPAVFVVGNTYQIMVPVTEESLFWVEVNGKCYYDEQNGVMRSRCPVHRVSVPMPELDAAKEYTVCEREIIERATVFPKSKDTVKITFKFRPIPKDNVRMYVIADTHDQYEIPIRLAKEYGNIDVLVMAGDIINHSGNLHNFDSVYKNAEGITNGEIPIIFARGNHDLRGYHAEKFDDYIPTQNGNVYYTFRLGNIWGMVLDTGEDKPDDHPEYGFTVACHKFRERETEFLKSVIKNAKDEYEADGIKYKVIIAHNPFAYVLPDPFDIELDMFKEWLSLIKENIKPDIMLCGHLHEMTVSPIGGSLDTLGQPCTTVVCGYYLTENPSGCGVTFYNDKRITAEFADGVVHEILGIG